MTTPSEVPTASTALPTAQSNTSSTGCSSSDMAGGRCHVIGFKFHDPVFQSTYIALSVVGVALVLLLVGALLIWCKKARGDQSLEREPVPHMARYSNHSPGPADYLDKKPWGWASKVRYDNHEAGLVGLGGGGKEKLDNLEVAALVSKRLGKLESGVLTLPSVGSNSKGTLYSLGLQGCPTPPSPPRVACPRHSPHSVRGGSLRRTLPHDTQHHYHHHHLPSVETDI